MKVGKCTIREHTGLETVVQKIGLNHFILPDPSLGQDAAFVAFALDKRQEEIVKLQRQVDVYDAELWMDALVPLLRRAVKKDPEACKLYRAMYWGANHIVNPMGFLRGRDEA